jgi:hypothetical protein
MHTKFILKRKTDESAIYGYCMEGVDSPIDGEMEFSLKSWAFKVIKPATGDDDGFHGRWMAPPLCRDIQNGLLPEKRTVAYG